MLRLLANKNFPGDAVTALQQVGHDIVWIRTAAPGSSDPSVLAKARAENRILITFDKDFGELVFRHGLPATSGVILFRISAPSAEYMLESQRPFYHSARIGRAIFQSSMINE